MADRGISALGHEQACGCVCGTAAQPPTPDQRTDGQHRGLAPAADLRHLWVAASSIKRCRSGDMGLAIGVLQSDETARTGNPAGHHDRPSGLFPDSTESRRVAKRRLCDVWCMVPLSHIAQS
jgi:hypothetical protein